MHDVVRTLEAYSRLFAKEDTHVEETYPEWDREAARAQLMNALGAHAIADGERNKIAYFNLALNRVRAVAPCGRGAGAGGPVNGVAVAVAAAAAVARVVCARARA